MRPANALGLTAAKATLVLGAGCLSGCGYAQWPTSHSFDGPSASMSRFQVGVAEAAFRRLINHNASGQQAGAGFFCLQLSSSKAKKVSGVPSDVVDHLTTPGVPIVNYPDCMVSANSSVQSRKAPGTGIIFYIDQINCRSRSDCEVGGGYYEANLSASHNTMILNNDGRGWIVKSSRLDWIS